MEVRRIKQLIGDAKIKEALVLLSEGVKNNDDTNTAITFTNRFKRTERDNMSGILSLSDHSIETNKLIRSIFSFLERFSEDNENSPQPKPQKMNNQKQISELIRNLETAKSKVRFMREAKDLKKSIDQAKEKCIKYQTKLSKNSDYDPTDEKIDGLGETTRRLFNSASKLVSDQRKIRATKIRAEIKSLEDDPTQEGTLKVARNLMAINPSYQNYVTRAEQAQEEWQIGQLLTEMDRVAEGL